MYKTFSNRNFFSSMTVFIVLFAFCNIAKAFIEREYTLREVINSSTNIVSGKVISVDKKRMIAVAEIHENLKGKTDFKRIQMNIAVGDTRGNLTSPKMMMSKLEEGLPILFFYEKKGRELAALGYVSKTWFQLFATDLNNKDKVWWRHTHIEAYMRRTFDGTVESLYQMVKDILSGKMWIGEDPDAVRVLVLTGNNGTPVQNTLAHGSVTVNAEFLTLTKFNKVGKHNVAYQEINDKNLPGLENADILWIGQGEIAEEKYFFNRKTEEKIKDFAQKGGIVIVVGQDSDQNRPCETGWITGRMLGVERPMRNDFQLTDKAGKLFNRPNKVRSGELRIDDTWTNWDNKFDILATTNSGNDIVVATLKEGKGMYIVTGIQNENEQDVRANAPLMQNLIYFAVDRIK